MNPLQSLRVLDLSRALAGPHCAQLLGDLGADVLKLEHPSAPDEIRGWPPFALDRDPGADPLGAYFVSANRNKEFAALDLSGEPGRALLHGLIDDSDVVVQNFRPDVARRFGLDYEAFRSAHPRQILCTISGFAEGPSRGEPAYDASIQALTGLMSLTGHEDGEVARVGAAVVDLTTGVYGALGVVAAVLQRQTDGHGRHVEVSLYDSAIATVGFQLLAYGLAGVELGRSGTRHPAMAPNKVFNTVDGGLLVMAGKEQQWVKLCGVLGCQELVTDVRFDTNAARVAHQDELYAVLEPHFETRTRAQWQATLHPLGIPCSPVLTMSEVYDSARRDGTMVGPAVSRSGESFDVVRNPILVDGQRLEAWFGRVERPSSDGVPRYSRSEVVR